MRYYKLKNIICNIMTDFIWLKVIDIHKMLSVYGHNCTQAAVYSAMKHLYREGRVVKREVQNHTGNQLTNQYMRSSK